jgi:hypothetical protein
VSSELRERESERERHRERERERERETESKRGVDIKKSSYNKEGCHTFKNPQFLSNSMWTVADCNTLEVFCSTD